LTADDMRRDSRHSLTNSTLTVTYLEQGAKTRAETPDDVFLLGRMYYRIGSLHAVQRQDHATAVTWYEKAVPMLSRPLPSSQASLQGRYGEWLVSMGISFWEVGRREDALKLTDEGTRHVEEAVGKNLLDRQALAVPYSNLSAMHNQLGHTREAEEFAELAAKLDGTARK
jgi:tetratricopeptide (TPR) repeat protein